MPLLVHGIQWRGGVGVMGVCHFFVPGIQWQGVRVDVRIVIIFLVRGGGELCTCFSRGAAKFV